MNTLEVSVDDRGVQRVALNRPDKRNAMSGEMMDELTQMARNLPEGTRAVVLEGRGPVFCAGGDLGWMKTMIGADAATRATEARRLATALGALNEMPAPLIGRIHGGAFGGGVGLACVCDVAVAEDGAKFGLTETRLGLIPATIGPYVIARMGEGRARRIFMSSRRIDADEAVDLDIIARAVPEAELDAAVESEIAPYLQVAPGAVAASKALARRLGPAIGEAEIEASVQALLDAWDGEEAAHGIEAFLSKTAPRWQA